MPTWTGSSGGSWKRPAKKPRSSSSRITVSSSARAAWATTITTCPPSPTAVIIIKGPDIKAGYKIKNAHVYDVLPTLLHLLGRPVAEDMDGKVIAEAFKDDFLKSHPVKTIPTYEGGTERKIAPENKDIDKKTLEDLRSLGYIK